MQLGIIFLFFHAVLYPTWAAISCRSFRAAEEAVRSGIAGSSPGFSQSTESSTYTLRGTVVNSVTGEPIRGALVQIYANTQRSVLTGADGRFQFEKIAAGSYFAAARKPGFFSEQELAPQRPPQQYVRVGQDAPAAVLKLIPEGIIHGRISGESGEGIEGIPVRLLFRSVQNGELSWQETRGAQTNEEGEFRLAELRPGAYYLFMGPGQTPVVLPPRPSEPGAKGYAAIFYPGVADLSSAAPIQITPGKRVEIMYSLPLYPLFRVSGSVSGAPAGVPVNLQFINAVGQGISSNVRLDQRTGEFQTGWLPAGSYTLKASAQEGQAAPAFNSRNAPQTYSASRSVDLSSNLSGVHLSLVPGITIPVSVSVETTRPQTGSDGEGPTFISRVGRGGQSNPPASVFLSMKEGLLSRMQYSAGYVGDPENKTLAIANVPPGIYAVQIYPNGLYYVQSARSGMSDLLRQEIAIAPGASVQPIEIVMRDDFANLHGKVSFDEQSAQAMVIALPDQSRRRQLQGIGMSNPTNPGFGFSLAPGSYKVIAFDRIDGLEYLNPEVVQKYLSKARDITLAPGESASVDLELVHVQE